MTLRKALATALKSIRKSRGLTQEDFGIVSSRTYLSTLERGLKSPTVDKLDDLASVLGVHPASLIVLSYAILEGNENAQKTIDQISLEVKSLLEELSSARREG